jgi:S1-C subfamily serine protease
MLNPKAISELQLSVCALGLRRVDSEQHKAEPTAPHFEIIGTGFAVSPELIVTNRHVLESIKAKLACDIYEHDSFLAQFLTLKPDGWSLHFCKIGDVGSCNSPDEDIGLLHVPGLVSLGDRAVTFGSPEELSLGESLAMLGYADGSQLLQANHGKVFDEELYRFGPVLQQGYLSATAPVFGCGVVTRLLLDIRTTSGLSGSPVFKPDTGEVIGIHFASNKTTTAFAVPLDSLRVQTYINNFLHSLNLL